jgi:hypothetical protein
VKGVEANQCVWTRKLIVAGLSLLCALVLSPRALAAEIGLENSPASVEIHGFVSQGFILTLRNEYLAPGSTSGSFEFSEVGLNFTTILTDTLQLGVQLFAQDLGASGNYTPKFDWFYLDYRWQDWLGFRAGRLKIPYGLYNEVQDVDSARVPILLPGSVYPLQSREILFAQSGGELYGFVRSPALGALDYRAFGGTIFIDPANLTPANAGFTLDLRVPYVLGGHLLWETPVEGLRIAGSLEVVRLETTVLIPSMPSIHIESQSLLWVGSAEYTLADLTLTAEYARAHVRQESDNPELSSELDAWSERAYAMATYRVGPWFQPGAYYSIFFPDVQHRDGRENVQHDLAMTLRFDINDYWLVKLEGHYMQGTAGLLNPLRVNPPDISTEDPSWGAFFLKTTAHF